MKSRIELEIDAPRGEVAALYADPRNSTAWMDDLERYEPLSGPPGMPGSTYRLVPKQGKRVFDATVLTRNLPSELSVQLETAGVTVHVSGELSELSGGRTRLVSQEVFEFNGFLNTMFGVLAQATIRRTHRRHMLAFKRFAEHARGDSPR